MLRERDGRHGPIAARLTGLSPADATGALIGREVLLDWHVGIESSRAGRALIEATANLVVRFCPQVRLRPATAFAGTVAERLVKIDSSADPHGATRADPLLVHLGGGGRGDVTGSAEPWVAHVSGHGDELPLVHDGGVVIGAHGAAALVASQIFVRALKPDPRMAGPSARTAYSLFEYGRPTMSPPTMSPPIIEGTILAGCGAVGQACVDVLVSSGARGRVPVIDNGFVDDPTNLNRSVLALEHDLEVHTPKVDLAVRRAQGSLLVIDPIRRSIEEVVAKIEAGVMAWPRVVLSALDNRPARWALQSLWPDLVLEGATGETMVQIFRHAHADGTACLRCLHPDEGDGRDYISSMAQATGLERNRVAAALGGSAAIVTERDVYAAAPEVHELVRAHLGRDMCGMLADVERLLGDRAAPAQLSVAFSSYLAGTFLAGELVKAAAGVATPLMGRYQIDPIESLVPDPPFLQIPSRTCFCQERSAIVEQVRTQSL